MAPLVLARSASAAAQISSTSGPRAANRRAMSFGSSLSPAAARSSRLLRLGCLAKPEAQSAPSPLVGEGRGGGWWFDSSPPLPPSPFPLGARPPHPPRRWEG